LRSELDNLRSAVRWGLDSPDHSDGELALRIIAGLAVQQGYDPSLGIGEWATWAVERAASTTPGRRYVVLATAAYHFAVKGEYERAGALAYEAMRDGIVDDAPWPFVAVTTLGYVDLNQGRGSDTLARNEAVLERFGDRIPPIDAVTLHAHAAGAANLIGDRERARLHAELARESGRRAGSPSSLASGHFAYGVSIIPDDPALARSALEEAFRWIEAGGSPVVYGHALVALAPLRAEAGEVVAALRALRDGLAYAADTGNASLSDNAGTTTLTILVRLGEPELGVSLLPQNWKRLAEGRGLGFNAAWLDAFEAARQALGDETFERALARAEAVDRHEKVEQTLLTLDRLIAERGDG
jgi:hypothetical protein